MKFKFGIGYKLAALLLAFGILPAAVIAVVAFNSTKQVEESNLGSFRTAALEFADKVDRNLFERYGDVQAFTYNEVLHDQASWYQASPDANSISTAMTSRPSPSPETFFQ